MPNASPSDLAIAAGVRTVLNTALGFERNLDYTQTIREGVEQNISIAVLAPPHLQSTRSHSAHSVESPSVRAAALISVVENRIGEQRVLHIDGTSATKVGEPADLSVMTYLVKYAELCECGKMYALVSDRTQPMMEQFGFAKAGSHGFNSQFRNMRRVVADTASVHEHCMKAAALATVVAAQVVEPAIVEPDCNGQYHCHSDCGFISTSEAVVQIHEAGCAACAAVRLTPDRLDDVVALVDPHEITHVRCEQPWSYSPSPSPTPSPPPTPIPTRSTTPVPLPLHQPLLLPSSLII